MRVTWTFGMPGRRPDPPYERRPRPYSRVAPHIRGRVFRGSPGDRRPSALWGFEVINTHTGVVLASDNCRIFAAVLDGCDEATAAARAAWFWDFKHKAVQ